MIPAGVHEVIDRDGDAWIRSGDKWSFLDDDLHLDEEHLVLRYGPVRYTATPIEITEEMVEAFDRGRGGYLFEGDMRAGLRAALEAAGFTVADGGAE